MSKTSQWAGYVTSVLAIVYCLTRIVLQVSGADFPDGLVVAMRVVVYTGAFPGVMCLVSASAAHGQRDAGGSTDSSPRRGCVHQPGDLALAVTQRVLGIVWLVVFGSVLVLWSWGFFTGNDHEDFYFRVAASPAFLFGAIVGYFLLFRGARWARIALGIMSLLTAVLVMIEAWEKRQWPDADGYLGLFALLSSVLLLFPRPTRSPGVYRLPLHP